MGLFILELKMPRFKERRKFVHEPSTKEIFYCLSNATNWVQLLIGNSAEKPYTDFLMFLIQKKFYEDAGEKLTIKRISEDFKEKSTKITSWIAQIYDDIFELNESKPEHFVKEGVKVNLQMSNYDNSCSWVLTLSVVPREFEMVTFRFVHANGY